MAMAKKDRFSDIRSFEELDASLRLLQREIDQNRASREVSQLFSGNFHLRWQDFALLGIRAVRRRLLK